MNLYRWNSKLMKQYGSGDIIVVAHSANEARKKVWEQWKPLEDGPTEDAYLQMLHLNQDPEYNEKLKELKDTLFEDMRTEPEIVTTGVIFIRGSE